ncbi:hypothetical protein M408DRAFT_328481 [Serendipita vermifera MAFF 305830]|uniref:NADPH--cytochrome P450 reductase n=1 Tax=Serendipita vermifera MAFF 305830 TaxID=933852 RepID=A0A0C3BF40_SERVB|nr:hypothetical protein M408DRAFT_328481 [Serendipita vermifera MAFF 305830]
METVFSTLRYLLGQAELSKKEGQESIPEPPKWPVLGHALLMDRENPSNTLLQLHHQYGDVYRLQFPGINMVIINSNEFAREVYDEQRFHKAVAGPLEELRGFVKDALFTAYHGERNWAIAHRILMPAFGPSVIKSMWSDMFDICSQMCLKWERFGADVPINPNENFTQLAFDTVALCTMGYRNNSFYQENTGSFISAMQTFMGYVEERTQLPKVVRLLKGHTDAKYQKCQDDMNVLIDKVIATRRKNRGVRRDLLELMLYGRDPKTNEGLTDENIRAQLITFLVAGHETTSGLLSFVMYYLLKHPDAYRKLQEEVDSVLGRDPIMPEHLSKLPYVTAVLRESLRLSPTVPLNLVQAFEDTFLARRYFVPKGQICVIQFSRLHRDPKVWGDDAEEFKPERMMDGKFEALPPKAWMPFGNGSRACIGRALAWQEAIIAVATMFQRFDFRLNDPDYSLVINQNLSLKPVNFFFHAIPRSGIPSLVATRMPVRKEEPKENIPISSVATNATGIKQGLRVLYGSNTGSALSFAERIVAAAGSKGFKPTLQTLDAAVSGQPLSKHEPIIIIAASFEGEPADNAVEFNKFLETNERRSYEGLRYAVFGVGNRDWVHTYQKVPRFIDETLSAGGAERIVALGEGDAGGDEFFETFEAWEQGLWDVLVPDNQTQGEDIDEPLDIKVVSHGEDRAITLRQPDLKLAYVETNRLLTKAGAPEKRHIEFRLPKGMQYQSGDYLTILPTNPEPSVRKVMSHFGLSPETRVAIRSGNQLSLPIGESIVLRELLTGYVELAQPATKRNLRTLAKHATTDDVRTILESLQDQYNEVLRQRKSIIDLLLAFPAINLPFATFLGMLPVMRIRQYSISSSPLDDPGLASLTVSVITSPAWNGSGEIFYGVGSTFLSKLQPSNSVQLTVRSSAAIFSLPNDISTPIVLFCAGSGIAPMRAFIQERAAQIAAGRIVGKALLFFGCRNPQEDFLYENDDLKQWEGVGAVDIRPAFSRDPAKSCGCKYVQDRILHDGDEVILLYRNGAKFFTCGSRNMAAGVREAYCKLIERSEGCDSEAAGEIFRKLQKERYATDIFG